jgi:hypothetical protein
VIYRSQEAANVHPDLGPCRVVILVIWVSESRASKTSVDELANSIKDLQDKHEELETEATDLRRWMPSKLN